MHCSLCVVHELVDPLNDVVHGNIQSPSVSEYPIGPSSATHLQLCTSQPLHGVDPAPNLPIHKYVYSQYPTLVHDFVKDQCLLYLARSSWQLRIQCHRCTSKNTRFVSCLESRRSRFERTGPPRVLESKKRRSNEGWVLDKTLIIRADSDLSGTTLDSSLLKPELREIT